MKKTLALAALLSTACNTGFTEAYEIDEPRVMAARLEVKGAPERAWPRVGEAFTKRLLVARSNHKTTLPLAQQLDAAVSVCIGGKLPNGNLFCVAELDLTQSMSGASKIVSFEELDISLSFGPIDPRAIGGSPNVLLFGGVCVEGKVQRVKGKLPGTDPATELYRCTDNESAELKEPLAFTDSVTVDYEDDPFDASLNPAFACDTSDEKSICTTGTIHSGEETRGGSIVLVRPKRKGAADSVKREVVEWNEVIDAREPLQVTGCATDPRFEGLKVKVGSDEHLIRMRFDTSDRENYVVAEQRFNKTVLSMKREELLISHAATKDGGKLGRYFSIIPRDATDKEAEIGVGYTPPTKSEDPKKAVSAAGRLVRFYFVVRDQRGGVDFTTRSLCLIP